MGDVAAKVKFQSLSAALFTEKIKWNNSNVRLYIFIWECSIAHFFHLSACFTGNWAQPNHNLRIRHYCYVTAIIEACIFLWQHTHIYLVPQATSDTSMWCKSICKQNKASSHSAFFKYEHTFNKPFSLISCWVIVTFGSLLWTLYES